MNFRKVVFLQNFKKFKLSLFFRFKHSLPLGIFTSLSSFLLYTGSFFCGSLSLIPYEIMNWQEKAGAEKHCELGLVQRRQSAFYLRSLGIKQGEKSLIVICLPALEANLCFNLK